MRKKLSAESDNKNQLPKKFYSNDVANIAPEDGAPLYPSLSFVSAQKVSPKKPIVNSFLSEERKEGVEKQPVRNVNDQNIMDKRVEPSTADIRNLEEVSKIDTNLGNKNKTTEISNGKKVPHENTDTQPAGVTQIPGTSQAPDNISSVVNQPVSISQTPNINFSKPILPSIEQQPSQQPQQIPKQPDISDTLPKSSGSSKRTTTTDADKPKESISSSVPSNLVGGKENNTQSSIPSLAKDVIKDSTPKPNQFTTTKGLPNGWQKNVDHKSGRIFYMDHNTKTTHWELPPAVLEFIKKQSPKVSQPTSLSDVGQPSSVDIPAVKTDHKPVKPPQNDTKTTPPTTLSASTTLPVSTTRPALKTLLPTTVPPTSSTQPPTPKVSQVPKASMTNIPSAQPKSQVNKSHDVAKKIHSTVDAPKQPTLKRSSSSPNLAENLENLRASKGKHTPIIDRSAKPRLVNIYTL